MSKVIEFNAREYKFDPTCNENVGNRMIITTDLGHTEVWEIGDWKWSWTQIFCEKTLPKNTDCIFRFAVSGGYCSTWDSVCRVYLYPTDAFADLRDAWEERMTFPLEDDKFAPTISKEERNGVLRVFELPFNTGENENWRITFVSQHSVARFMKAFDNSAYNALQNLTLAELKNRETNNCSDSFQYSWGENLGNFVKGITNRAVHENLGNAFSDVNSFAGSNNISNREFTESEFAELLNGLDDGSVVNFSNIRINPNSEPFEKIIIGSPIDGAVFSFTNVQMTSLGMSEIIAKLCDGCVVTFLNANVSADNIDNMIGTGYPSDGLVINISNITLPERVMSLINSKKGDGGVISAENVTTFPA